MPHNGSPSTAWVVGISSQRCLPKKKHRASIGLRWGHGRRRSHCRLSTSSPKGLSSVGSARFLNCSSSFRFVGSSASVGGSGSSFLSLAARLGEAHQSVCRRHLDILHQSARLLPLEAAALLSLRSTSSWRARDFLHFRYHRHL